ncbi:MAG: NAD-dependent epimerase/dehydratase family protein [Candidatus Altiarchaeota archaeon]
MERSILVTGGAGFIGSHLAEHHLRKGDKVTVVDNLSRTRYNIEFLEKEYPGVDFRKADVSDPTAFDGLMDGLDIVYHCAAQVAVTTSLTDPRLDFNTNAVGTFNLCEAVRKSGCDPAVVFCSTNKVYGDLELPVVKGKTRYMYKKIRGIDESYPLETNCPYGGSKINAEFILDTYKESFGLKVAKPRMSCIYGTRQFGNEDQGWVAWFIIAAVTGKPITIYGDGKQVRDILYVTDQNSAFEKLALNIKKTSGQAYNLGGGTEFTTSLDELLGIIEDVTGKRSEVGYGDWRMGDQKVYVSDTRKIKKAVGWKPKVGVREGVRRIADWTSQHIGLFK